MFGDLPSFLWGEAINNAIYILNRCPTKAIEGKTLYEAWIGKKPNISHFRVFGCDAYAFVVLGKGRSLIRDPSSRLVFMSRDVKFN